MAEATTSYVDVRACDDVGVGAFLFVDMEEVQHPKNDLVTLKICCLILYATYL